MEGTITSLFSDIKISDVNCIIKKLKEFDNKY